MPAVAKKASRPMAIEPTAKIVVNKSVELPEFRKGTAVAKRVNAVLSSNGKPVETAIKKGARASTVRFLAKAKVIVLKIAPKAKSSKK